MKSATLIAALSWSPADPKFDAWLTAHRVFDRPHHAYEDEDYADDENAAEQNARASLIQEDERSGVCLIYDERENFERRFGPARSPGDFILEEVAFFAHGVQRYQGYRDELPMGLSFGASPAKVHATLGPPTATRTVHELQADLYLFTDLVLNVSYLPGDAGASIVRVRLPHLYDLRMMGQTQAVHDPRAPDLGALLACLGRSGYDPALTKLLKPLGWDGDAGGLAGCDDVMDLLQPYGLTLYYRNARDYPALAKHKFPRDRAVFAGFRVNRRGDMGSEGYAGKLPLGIEFHHTPQQVIQQVGMPPDWQSIGDDTGAFKWKQPDCVLHVMFSLIDMQVYRVSCFAKFMEDELFLRPGD